ncbi:MAG: RNase P subunit p30 family protein [Nanoarchaeota archaeon]
MDFVLKRELGNSSLNYADLIICKNQKYLKKKINDSRGLCIVKGGDDEVNRTALEIKRTDILLSPEFNREKDFIHFRNSGLNHVLCKLAKKNEVAIGFSFSDLMNSKNKEIVLGRMMQNVFLCRKFKVKMVLGSFALKENEVKNRSELISFGNVIGMNGKEVKDALNFRKKEGKIKILK